jgi:hypothetical protein
MAACCFSTDSGAVVLDEWQRVVSRQIAAQWFSTNGGVLFLD